MLALYAQAIASAEALACDALLLRVLARDAAPPPRHPRPRPSVTPAPASMTIRQPACRWLWPMRLSRYQTLRAFARDTGMTPHAYQVQRRLLLARGWIRAGATLADAARPAVSRTRAT